MQKIAKAARITLLSFAFFLVSPFPFEYAGWQLFGGYRIIKPFLPYADGMAHESDLSRGFYSSSWYPVLLLLSSLILGTLTDLFVQKILRRKQRIVEDMA